LVLRNLNICDDDLGQLAAAMATTREDDLEMLNLNFNNITEVGARHVAAIVKSKPNLQLLL
jgi:hypothetical protein